MSYINFNINGNFYFTYIGQNVTFVINCSVNNNNIAILINSSTITYGNTPSSTNNINLMGTGTLNNGVGSGPNDNYVISTEPFFDTQGLAFIDISDSAGFGNIEYNMYNNSGIYYIFNNLSNSSDILTVNVTSSCLLDITKILLINNEEKLISDLVISDIICCPNGTNLKIKNILKTPCLKNSLPFKIPKGVLNANEDLYLSNGHAVFKDGKWVPPSGIPCIQMTIENMKFLGYNTFFDDNLNCYPYIIYYHIELDLPDKSKDIESNRRKYGLLANGVNVESFSVEPL